MKGRVTKYFAEKGYGFVKDENGNSRFFHVSNVKVGEELLEQGATVTFTPHSNEKGLTCLNIEVAPIHRAKFISIGNTNLRVSNIKEFGVSLSSEVKAIKAPIFQLNPEYVAKKQSAGSNIFKKMLLPEKYIMTGQSKEVSRSEFEKVTFTSREEYRLPYILVKTSGNNLVKDHNRFTFIDADKAEKVYWKYLYVTTYQNDNYRFYEYDIDIDETRSRLNELLNC